MTRARVNREDHVRQRQLKILLYDMEQLVRLQLLAHEHHARKAALSTDLRVSKSDLRAHNREHLDKHVLDIVAVLDTQPLDTVAKLGEADLDVGALVKMRSRTGSS